MESKWLEDFISLAQTHSFSRSAEQRHVTQSAFSRRIKSLEAWIGIDLIDRTSFPTSLTREGHLFYEQAIAMLGQINDVRALLRENRASTESSIDFAVHHTLALTYIPKWLIDLKSGIGPFGARLAAFNVHDAVLVLSEGGCDLLLTFYHPLQPLQLDASRYDMMIVGCEKLCAFSRCDQAGRPEFALPGSVSAPLPYLSYASAAYFGRIVDLIQADALVPLHLEKCYETGTAEALKMMALEGHGLAFLPESAVAQELAQQRLVRADSPQLRWEADMEIRLYREKPSSQKPGKRLVAQLWDYLYSHQA
ncbi:MAG: LysR family transcriptional regulator [Glaciimonas sp.]|nr:LysR family transcriptional regulator [Glaciimonas sp.]